jgi:hypothetical protein
MTMSRVFCKVGNKRTTISRKFNHFEPRVDCEPYQSELCCIRKSAFIAATRGWAGVVIPILVCERASGKGSPYVIQGFNPTDPGRSKLNNEGMVSLKVRDGRPRNCLQRNITTCFSSPNK